MDLAILAFVGLTIVSSIFSYETEVSLRKLVGVSLVTIVYLVLSHVRDASIVRKLTVVLIVAGVSAAVFAIGTFAVGKNLKVVRLAADSPLRSAGVAENDTIVIANGKSISSPDQLADVLVSAESDVVPIKIYRYEVYLDHVVSRAAVANTGDNAQKLGIVEWARGRDARASGFYGHYTTFAEAVQLILSVAFGLLICVPGGVFARNRVVLLCAVAAFGIALFLTVTRASWAGFVISAAVMILIGTSRKTIFTCIACAVPVALAGVFYLQQKRNVAFIDTKDGSTTWRMTVWREGVDLLTSSPRHLIVGVGMDSIKTRHPEWGLFDGGRLPVGHMHSTPLQIALERGLLTLIAWIVWMFIYLKLLWRGFRRNDLEWPERGLLLGAFGGTIGFLASGLVHYNWGDSEVVMIFYLLMGLSLAAAGERPLSEPPA